jgi:hypothetical protein
LAKTEREKGTTRRRWLLAGLALPLFRARAAGNLSATYDGDNLYPAAPDFHFLTPKVVARLRDSADTQAFISQLTIFGGQDDASIIRQTHKRLIVSYSIWEETFTVAIPGLHSQEGLSAAKAESWCLENLAISASGLDPIKPFRMRFELRSVRRQDLSRVIGDMGISLVSMIDIFSRKAGAGEETWTLNTDWLRLFELPRLSGRPAHRG